MGIIFILFFLLGLFILLLVVVASVSLVYFVTDLAANTVSNSVRIRRERRAYLHKVAAEPQTSLLRSSTPPEEVKEVLLRPSEETTANTNQMLRVPALEEATKPEAEQTPNPKTV